MTSAHTPRAAALAAPLVEGQDRPRNLARLHRAERLVDVLETSAPAHHVVQVQPPLAVEVEISRHIDMETIGAHEAAPDLLFDVEMTGEQFNLLTRRNRPDQRA